MAQVEGQTTASFTGVKLNKAKYAPGENVPADFVDAATGNVYRVEFRYATAVINEASDFAYFVVGADNWRVKNNSASVTTDGANTVTYGGYVIMQNDVTTGTLPTFIAAAAYDQVWYNGGFNGTFEGNGYGLKNLTLTRGGLFGAVNGGTVQNFSVVNCSIANMWNAESNIFGMFAGEANVNNVYVSMETDVRAHSGIFGRVTNTVKIENCVINVWNTGYAGNEAKWGFTRANLIESVGGVYENIFTETSNVYFVSNAYIFNRTNRRWYGSNASEQALKESEAITNTRTINGIERYTGATNAAANTNYKNATKTLTALPEGFNANLWRIDATNGLVWQA